MASETKSLVPLLASASFVKGDGTKVSMEELQGKTIGLYFGASRSAPSRAFTKRLLEVYNELKQGGASFEVVFISDDESESEFQKSLQDVPWPALVFADRATESFVAEHCKVERIPALVILRPDLSIVPKHGRGLVIRYGSRAFPFTDEHIASLEKQQDEKVSTLPSQLHHPGHEEHTLELVKDPYDNFGMFGCDICGKEGNGWAYHCKECSHDLHPGCADPASDLIQPLKELPIPVVPVSETKHETKTEVVRTRSKNPFWWLLVGMKASVMFFILLLYKIFRRDPWEDSPSSSSSSGDEPKHS